MSFFSKKQTSNSPKKENLFSDDTIVIRTMEDDLQDLRNGIIDEPKPSIASASVKEPVKILGQDSQSQQTPNQNPFITSYQNKIATETNPSPFIQNQNISPDVSETEIQPENTHKNTKLVIAFIVLILIIISGGWYYFNATRKTPNETAVIPPSTQPSANNTNTPESVQIFSINTPNFLPIDVQRMTPSDIQTLLAKTATQADDLHSAKPIEFLITDTNNNPVSFATFSRIAGIQVSQEVQSLLGDRFSLYVFSDIDTPFLGIAIDAKNNETKIKENLKKNESNLINWFKPLMINVVSLPENPVFSNSNYLSTNIRFFNIDTTHRTSFDYTLYGQKLIIGTSKNTLRSIIDTIQF